MSVYSDLHGLRDRGGQKDGACGVGDTSGVPVLGSCHGLASARSGCAARYIQVRQMLTRVERVMHTKTVHDRHQDSVQS